MYQRLHPLPKKAFPWFIETQLQWTDSDLYGHLNNVSYLAYFDTALNMALVEHGALDPTPSGQGPIGLVVQNGAQFFAEVAFPSRLHIGVRVESIGRSSLTWGFGLFARDAALCAARGYFVHVYVDRDTRRPQPLGPSLSRCAEALFVDPTSDPATGQ
ncbi:MAG: acyl-CoA thioesterase [Pararhodobacter sp.]|nr:acyl-CoA thioesterase [Pararhodobacter sp.]